MIAAIAGLGGLGVAAFVGYLTWLGVRAASRRDRRDEQDRLEKKIADAVATAKADVERSHGVAMAAVAHDLQQMTDDRNYWRGRHDALQDRLNTVARGAGLVEPDA